MRFLVAIFIALVCGIVNAAAPVCYEYSVSGAGTVGGIQTGTGSSAESACGDLAGKMSGTLTVGPDTYTYAHSVVGVGYTGDIATSCTTKQITSVGGMDISESSQTNSVSRTEVDCPEDDCESMAGQNAFLGMSTPIGDSCINGCVVSATAAKSVVRCNASGACSDYILAQTTHSGQSCDAEPDAQEGNCISGAFGRICIRENDDDNCGVFNGDRVCVDAIESGCQSYASGGMACVVEGPGATEGVPDDGEGGPAAPQMQVEKDGKVVNYYNSTTVGGSSTTVVTNEAPGGGGAGGSGDGLGEVEQCEGEEDCYGGLPESFGECAEDLTDCITAAATTAWTGLQENVPLLAFTASIHTSLAASGSCPEAVISVFEETYDVMAPVCSILVDNAGLLSLILQICWSLMGVRILFGGE